MNMTQFSRHVLNIVGRGAPLAVTCALCIPCAGQSLPVKNLALSALGGVARSWELGVSIDTSLPRSMTAACSATGQCVRKTFLQTLASSGLKLMRFPVSWCAISTVKWFVGQRWPGLKNGLVYNTGTRASGRIFRLKWLDRKRPPLVI